MKQCIHAFTDTIYKTYPGFISVNKEPDMSLTITVRAAESDAPQTLKVTAEQLEHMANDIIDFLHRKQ